MLVFSAIPYFLKSKLMLGGNLKKAKTLRSLSGFAVVPFYQAFPRLFCFTCSPDIKAADA